MTPTNSSTASTDFWSMACSSEESLISTTSSKPDAPSLTGYACKVAVYPVFTL